MVCVVAWRSREMELGAVVVVAVAASEARGRFVTTASAEGKGVWQPWEGVGASEMEN
jgi:hypothetical protein